MPPQEATDAIALLKSDHRRVEDLFDKFEAARSGAKQKLAEQICNELKIHATIEEEIFYPALRGEIEESTLNEAYVEHDGAKLLVNDILAGGPEDSFYEAKVKVLSEEIKHHVREEEQRGDGMFAQARASGVDLLMLRDQMIARRKELMDLARADNLPPAQMQAVGVGFGAAA